MFQRPKLVRLVCPLVLCAGLGARGAHASILADSDGDGVDDAVDCRSADATTWAVPNDASGLMLAGAAATTFHWTAPSSPGGTAILYDLIRATSPSGFNSGSCLDSSDATTSPAITDAAVPAPGTAFFYLVRSKTACGGTLGTDSNNVARTGVTCSTANGGSCAIGASCAGGWCCGGSCSDLTTDAGNCGACGHVCIPAGGTNACVAGGCFPICGPVYGSCDGIPDNGCETALVTPINCGGCGIICDGYGQTADNVTCDANESCTFSCQGEHYDVDGNKTDGCEAADSPTGNHTQPAALGEGSKSCNDADTFSFGGTIINDTQVHEVPAITGFDSFTGSAPDWMSLSATGGFTCIDDLNVTLTLTSALSPACYKLTVITDVGQFSCAATVSGSCTVTHGSGAYHDGTTVYFEVQRTCSPQTNPQAVSYTVGGHL